MADDGTAEMMRRIAEQLEIGNRQRRGLLDWSNNSYEANIAFICTAIGLVLFAGCMSGLTLGLLSLDKVDLEVLKRSGTPQEQRWANRIIPVVKNSHFLLVTLLLCNAIAMEALPIVLDKMVHEVVAVLISVTAVLLFGEVIPQAVCSKYGLQIGASLAWVVHLLMILTSPISYPISKLLDWSLGSDHAVMMRRKQLKALVGLHSKEEGFGGKLSKDEIQIISGALDLTTKTAYYAMTPLHKVFMVSSTQRLDDITIASIMTSKPFSRLPVYEGNDRSNIIGLILVKELLEYVKRFPDAPVSSLKIRPIPILSASTPMYDMLKLFRTGRSHLALLTQPEQGLVEDPAAEKDTVELLDNALPRSDLPSHSGPDGGLSRGHSPPSPRHVPLMETGSVPVWRGHTHSTGQQSRWYEPPTPSAQVMSGGDAVVELNTMSALESKRLSLAGTPDGAVVVAETGPVMGSPSLGGSAMCQSMSVASPPAQASAPVSRSSSLPLFTAKSPRSEPDEDQDEADAVRLAIPMIARPGEAIGIITIEDVIEELMQFEIIDETDQYVDNEQTKLVTDARLEDDLPENIKTMLTMAEAVKFVTAPRPGWQEMSSSSYPGVATGSQQGEHSSVKAAMAAGAGKLTSLVTSVLGLNSTSGEQSVGVDTPTALRSRELTMFPVIISRSSPSNNRSSTPDLQLPLSQNNMLDAGDYLPEQSRSDPAMLQHRVPSLCSSPQRIPMHHLNPGLSPHHLGHTHTLTHAISRHQVSSGGGSRDQSPFPKSPPSISGGSEKGCPP